MPLSIDNIKRSLHDDDRTFQPKKNTRHAAVAAILRPLPSHTEALFILRSTKEGDPWSGQMAFPGGHYEDHDLSLRDTAERETMEEIGLDLRAEAHFLGKIHDVEANPRGRDFNIVVSPFVYQLHNLEPSFSPNYEVADVLWGSLTDMFSGENVTQLQFPAVSGQSFPGYGVGDQVVWGLTLRMLDHFFKMLDDDWITNYE